MRPPLDPIPRIWPATPRHFILRGQEAHVSSNPSSCGFQFIPCWHKPILWTILWQYHYICFWIFHFEHFTNRKKNVWVTYLLKVENQRNWGQTDWIKHRLEYSNAVSDSMYWLMFQFQNQSLKYHSNFDICRICANKYFECKYLDAYSKNINLYKSKILTSSSLILNA